MELIFIKTEGITDLLKYSDPLKFLLIVLLLFGLGLNAATGQTLSEQQAAEETYIDGLRLLGADIQEPRLEILGIHLGYVENDTKPGGGKYFCGALSRSASLKDGKIIVEALSTLSDTSLKKLGLKYVILCSRAMAGKREIGGIPVPPLNLLMLNVGESDNNDNYLQHIFLHELYHLIEYRFKSFQDSDWQRRFGSGYSNSYRGIMKRSPVGSGKKGFLNAYATSFPHEERAELFAYLSLMPAEVIEHIRSTDDKLLKEKAQYLAKKIDRLMGVRISLPGL